MEIRGKHPQGADVVQKGAGAPVLTSERAHLLSEIYTLPGRQILNRILNVDEPRKLIQGLTCEDFYWLIKKMGTDDCVPFLELASTDQW